MPCNLSISVFHIGSKYCESCIVSRLYKCSIVGSLNIAHCKQLVIERHGGVNSIKKKIKHVGLWVQALTSIIVLTSSTGYPTMTIALFAQL